MGTMKKVLFAFGCVGLIGANLLAGGDNLKKDPRDTGRYRGDVRKEKRFRIMGRSAHLTGPTGVQSGMGQVSAVLPNPPLFNYPVYDIEVYDGKAYVVGGFDRVSQERMGYGIPVDKETGQAISGFDPINGKVENVVEDGNGGWYINGYFTRVGTTDRAGFAHILPNGKLDPNWNLSVQLHIPRQTDPPVHAKLTHRSTGN
ncbi:MAG: hypothetical protein IPN19_07885 [Elusimicrobia bacterium]|nr:hypothetical protein [Elusimicrobiota bacterium]